MNLTPAHSRYCGPEEYCYWNGQEATKPPAWAGLVYTDKAFFVSAIYNDLGWGTAMTTGEPNDVWTPARYATGPESVGRFCQIGGPGFHWVEVSFRHRKHVVRFPHIGGVLFGLGVTIGSYVTIDRGGIGDTVIGRGVHIDSHVHIGHNATIGNDTIITAGAIIGGSAIIGEDVWIGLGAVIRNQLTIGDGAVIGIGAVVVKDVPAGEVWAGNPAKELK